MTDSERRLFVKSIGHNSKESFEKDFYNTHHNLFFIHNPNATDLDFLEYYKSLLENTLAEFDELYKDQIELQPYNALKAHYKDILHKITAHQEDSDSGEIERLIWICQVNEVGYIFSQLVANNYIVKPKSYELFANIITESFWYKEKDITFKKGNVAKELNGVKNSLNSNPSDYKFPKSSNPQNNEQTTQNVLFWNGSLNELTSIFKELLKKRYIKPMANEDLALVLTYSFEYGNTSHNKVYEEILEQLTSDEYLDGLKIKNSAK